MIKKYPFSLDPLPYAYDLLEPVIDKETMMIHHDKHHQAYVDNLNKALSESSELQNWDLIELMKSEVPAVKNNAGGVWNHDFFWQEMVAPGSVEMGESVRNILKENFGSVEEFMSQFETAALGRFGSGWAWLVKNDGGGMEIVSTANQDNPLILGKMPVLGIDVWEHAYYLKYQNRRVEYVKAWWKVVNWNKVAEILG